MRGGCEFKQHRIDDNRDRSHRRLYDHAAACRIMSTPGDVTQLSRLTSAAASAASSHGRLLGGSDDRCEIAGGVAHCGAGSLVRGFYVDDRHISVSGIDCYCKHAPTSVQHIISLRSELVQTPCL